jgi:serine/threonine-protein kinase
VAHVPFIVMEYVEGHTVREILKGDVAAPIDEAVEIVSGVLSALDYSHHAGLVHRDIKPANVFLCRYGEECDFVKVLDFGIVRAARDGADTGPLETVEEGVEGTPAYMAPEQALGGTVDARADIYATGCVAYWLLTGELVFTGENAIAVMMQHAHTAPAPPSSRTGQPIPRELERLVLSCLAKDPADRPGSARELAHRLGAIGGMSEWTQERAKDWWTSIATAPVLAGVA